MTSHLLYEGSQLERVLERVRTDHGDRAAIVSADRARSGGFGGFFTKEVFRVTVAVSDGPSGATPAAAVGEDAATTSGDVVAGSVAPGRATLGRIGDGVEPADLELWGIVGSGLVGAATSTPTSGPDFAAALEEALVEQPAVALEPTQPRLVSGLTRHEPPLVVGSHRRSPSAATHATPTLSVVDSGAAAGVVTARLTDAASDREAQVARVVELRPHRVRRGVAAHAELGHLLAELEQGWTDAPAMADKGLVVVLGAPAEARRLALLATDALGIAADDVLVASPRQPVDELGAPELDAIRDAVESVGARLVVVEVLPGREGHEWARAVATGLGCAQVRLALGASRPVAALDLTITALGGAEVIDVVDLLDVADAPDPGELLDLDVVVATLDGRTVSPTLWAATIVAARRAAEVADVRIDRRPAVGR